MPSFCFGELEFRFSRLQGAHFTSWTTLPVPFLAVFNQTPLQSARVLRMLPSSCWGATTVRPLSHLPGYCHRCCLSTGICDKSPCTWLTSSSFPALVTLCPDSIPFHHRCSSWYTWALTFHPGLCFPCVFSLTTHQLIHSWGVSLPPPLVLTSLTQGFLSIHPMDHLLPPSKLGYRRLSKTEARLIQLRFHLLPLGTLRFLNSCTRYRDSPSTCLMA